MSIFKTVYDTVSGSGYRLNSIEESLKKAHVTGNYLLHTFHSKVLDKSFSIELITGGHAESDVIPFFNHPIQVFDNASKKKIWFLDVRPYGKMDKVQNEFIIRNQVEYDWSIQRCMLNILMDEESVTQLTNLSSLPLVCYGSLISETVTRKYALDPLEQITILVLAMYFYYCLSTDDKDFDEVEFNKICGRIAQLSKVPATKVFDILEGVNVIHGLTKFCEVVRDKTGSVRLADFNEGVLIAIIAGTWIGTNARENMAASLEHIPTWIMICYASINDSTYKRSVFAKLVEKKTKGEAGNSFVKSINALIN
jgi:hypothetical protein